MKAIPAGLMLLLTLALCAACSRADRQEQAASPDVFQGQVQALQRAKAVQGTVNAQAARTRQAVDQAGGR